MTVRLDYPVRALDGRLLLPAGTALGPKVMRELVASNADRPYRKYPFLGHGSVRRDIVRLLRQPPYSSVFRAEENSFALGLMGRMWFAAPFLDFIDYAKANDDYTYRHVLMVFALSTILVRDLITESEDWIREAMAGTLHDLGKVCVPLDVLKKSDPLSRTEKNLLEHHAPAGFVLVSHYLRDAGSCAARVTKGHHERRDGSGYPLGVRLRDGMVEIIAACDVYDALLSPRPYRPTPFDNRTALEVITDMARQGKLGWSVVQALVAHNRKDRPPLRRCVVSAETRGTPPSDSRYGKIAEDVR